VRLRQPGQIMSATALLAKTRSRTDAVSKGDGGNICRCATYYAACAPASSAPPAKEA